MIAGGVDVTRTRDDQHHRHNSNLPDDREVVHQTNRAQHGGVFQSDNGKIPGRPISDTTVTKIAKCASSTSSSSNVYVVILVLLINISY